MKSSDLIRELAEAGCELKRHNGGSHQIWWSPLTGKTFPVPHPKRICRSAHSNQSEKWQESKPETLWR